MYKQNVLNKILKIDKKSTEMDERFEMTEHKVSHDQ